MLREGPCMLRNQLKSQRCIIPQHQDIVRGLGQQKQKGFGWNGGSISESKLATAKARTVGSSHRFPWRRWGVTLTGTAQKNRGCMCVYTCTCIHANSGSIHTSPIQASQVQANNGMIFQWSGLVWTERDPGFGNSTQLSSTQALRVRVQE